jgi:NAD(P)-dependent dehydrogenase (short-subunit alcohol dehydrogenase family)
MDTLRFDGRTAIVTGAGGNPGLGRAHAMLLAARGARVVVNDIGRDPASSHYRENASAEAVAAEIRALGGEAICDTHSVTTQDGAEALVQTALEAFGSLDILVNNAGLSLAAAFDDMTPLDFERHIQVNLMGTVMTCRAAWTHMKGAGYGRIVNTASIALAGFGSMVAYGASKGGVLSLSRGLAVEGAPFGIKVNVVNPGAFTRMMTSQQDEANPMVDYARTHLSAELASPVVAFLAHEGCPVTGECIEAVGGEVRRTYLAQTPGFTDRSLTLETLASRWDEVMAGADSSLVPIAAMDTSQWGFRPYRSAR